MASTTTAISAPTPNGTTSNANLDWRPATTTLFKTYHISPQHPSFPFLAGKFSALRLRALSASPNSFAVRFVSQASLTPAQWETYLSRSGFFTFVCVRHELLASLDPAARDAAEANLRIEQGEWIGHISLLGPYRKVKYDLPTCPPAQPDEVESKWQMTALYTDPDYRGKSIATQLVNTGLEFARTYSSDVEKARVRIFTAPMNDKAVAMYEHFGFKRAGNCTLVEALVANGDGDQIPREGQWKGEEEKERYNTRQGIAMDRVLQAEPRREVAG